MLSGVDRVLVTGGTGFTGRVLVRRLCSLGCRVRVLARPSSDRAGLEDLPIEWIEGEVFDAAAVANAVEGVHYIFHVAAAYRNAEISDSVYERVNVESTKLLAGAAARLPSFKRFVHVSTVGVLGHIERPPADETAPYNPGDIYQRTKAEAERWLLEFAGEHALPFVVVRPAAIYGPGDRRLLKVFRMARLPIVPLIGWTRGFYHLIHVEDLAEFMIYAAENPSAAGQVFICGNPSATTIKGIVEAVAARLGKRPFFLRLPAWPFFLTAAICEIACKPLRIEPPIYRRRVAFFTKDRSFDTSKMRRLTNFEYKYTDAEGLCATTDWYQAHRWM
jgi:nucleoside-diphosphate-sugar epimerase